MFLTLLSAAAVTAVFLLLKNGYRVGAILVVVAMLLSMLWQSFYIYLDKTPRELLLSSDETTFEVLSYSEKTSSGNGVSVTAQFRFFDVKYTAIVYVSGADTDLSPGDVISGKPSFSELENNETFSGVTYYKSRHIDIVCFLDDMTLVSEAQKISVEHLPAFLSKSFKDMTDRLFSGESAAFLKALILSDRGNLDEETIKDFRRTGLSHTTSVSGFHISFIVGLLILLTKNKYLKLLFIPVIFLFVLMVGAPPSAIRAAIMQTLLIVSSVSKREYDPLTSLSFAGFLLVIFNPHCATDIGFILSFLSSFGIIFMHDKVMKLFQKPIRNLSGIWRKFAFYICSAFTVSISAMIFTAPVLAISFNYLSIISPIANVLLIPFITLAFSCGVMVVLFGFICFPVAKGAALVMNAFVGLIMNIVKAMAALPFAEVIVKNPTVVMFICFVCFALVYWISVGRKKIRLRVVLISVAGAILALFATFMIGYGESGRDGLRVDVLDVGQGQCVVVTSGEACAVIDCGGDKDAAGIAISHMLKNRIEDIDAMILTHAHADHTNGALQLAKTISTDMIYMPATDRESATFQKLCKGVEGRSETVFQEKDLRVNVDGIDVEILAMPQQKDENENGLVIIVRDGDYELLVTGDIPSSCEKLVLEKIPDCESYIVGHHGSKSSSSQALLNKALPELCVISVGINNEYGHPSYETLRRIEKIGANISRTDVSGTLTFYSREDKKVDDNEGLKSKS